MTNSWVAALIATASAATIAWGTVLRQRIAEEVPSNDIGRLGPIVAVIKRPLWWAGSLISLAGYALQAVALLFGSLLLVQPIIVLALMFALPLEARYAGRRVTAPEWIWATILTGGVAVFVLVGKPQSGLAHPGMWHWAIALGSGILLLWAMLALARVQRRRNKAILLGIAAGVAFGYVAVFTKAAVDRWGRGGIPELLTHGEIYGLIAAAVVGTAVQQAGFHAGALQQSLPAMTVMEPVAASVLGVGVMGERFAASESGVVVLALALIGIVLGTIMLARSEAAEG